MPLHLTPDFALFVATTGICLIYVELNRPGLIIPGSLGLLLTLFATAAMLQHPLNPWAVLLLAAAAATLTFHLYRVLPTWLLAANTLALDISFRWLVKAPNAIHTITAIGCGTLLGVLSAVLSRIALRARTAKAIH